MIIDSKVIKGNRLTWTLRSPRQGDASVLSRLRIELDGETEYLDREPGEDYLSGKDFKQIVLSDASAERSVFLVADVDGKIVGYARCAGKILSRFRHQAEFGICILKEYWGYGIGKKLLENIICWSEEVGIEKITLTVLETNSKAIELYKKYGFVQEGLLQLDRKHKDGKYYNTVIMARFI